MQLKILVWNTIEFIQMSFSFVPKVFNSVNVVMLFCKMCTVIVLRMAEFTYIQYVVTPVICCINDIESLNSVILNATKKRKALSSIDSACKVFYCVGLNTSQKRTMSIQK